MAATGMAIKAPMRPRERASDQGGDNGEPRRDLHGVFHHPRVEKIVLQEPVGDVESSGGDANGQAFGECHRGTPQCRRWWIRPSG